MAEFTVTISQTGLEELERHVSDRALLAPFGDALKRAAFIIEGAAKIGAPVGISGGAGLRGSITTEFDMREPFPLWALVQARVPYAAYVEFGTRPHWPPSRPGSPLSEWVRLKLLRRGIAPRRGRGEDSELRALVFLVARKISRVGTKPHPFMRPALQVGAEAVPGLFQDAADEVAERIAHG